VHSERIERRRKRGRERERERERERGGETREIDERRRKDGTEERRAMREEEGEPVKNAGIGKRDNEWIDAERGMQMARSAGFSLVDERSKCMPRR